LIIHKIITPLKLEKRKAAATPESGRGHFYRDQPADAQKCTTAPTEPNVFRTHNSAQPQEPYRRPKPKIGRNDPLPLRQRQEMQTMLPKQISRRQCFKAML
jgi:hypothetical protein